MLHEKIFYDAQLPIRVTTVDLGVYPMHYHEDLEILCVLRGSVRIWCASREAVLSEGELYLFNSLELHRIDRITQDNMIMMLHLDRTYFGKYYPDLEKEFFAAEAGSEAGLGDMRMLMAAIMKEMLQKGADYEGKVIETTHNLIACLQENFRYEETDGKAGRMYSGRTRSSLALAIRLRRILGYMAENYGRKLTLNEISEREDLSLYYLSHVIKEAAGMSFQDLLNYMRVESTEEPLAGTNRKIGKIASEAGFSAVRYYIKHFEHWYGMHPQEFRKLNRGKEIRHSTEAEYTRSSPVMIEEVIRSSGRLRAEYGEMSRLESVVIEVDAAAAYTWQKITEEGLAEILRRHVNRSLAEPFQRFRRMNEWVVASGRNYVITTRNAPAAAEGAAPGDGRTAPIDSLSIILYNIDDAMENSLRQVETDGRLLEVLETYETEMEFLLHLRGFEGRYRVIRYRLNKRHLLKRANDSAGRRGILDYRERLLNELSAAPIVDAGLCSSSEIANIRAVFTGIGMEMILLDRVD